MRIGDVVYVKVRGSARPMHVTDVHAPDVVSGYIVLSPIQDHDTHEAWRAKAMGSYPLLELRNATRATSNSFDMAIEQAEFVERDE